MLPRVRGTRRRAVDCVIYLDFSALQHDSVHAQRAPAPAAQHRSDGPSRRRSFQAPRPASSCRACCTACRTSSERLRGAVTRAARLVDRRAQRIVLPLRHTAHTAAAACGRPDRARAGRRPRLPPRRRAGAGLGRKPRQVADDDRFDPRVPSRPPVGAVFIMHQMGLGFVPRVADQLISRRAPFLVAEHFRAAVAAHQQP